MGQLTSDILDKLIGPYRDVTVAVETGTWKGESTRILAERFHLVYTIELCPKKYRQAKKSLKERPNIEHIHGDSVAVLGDLVKRLRLPVFWYLDAHWFLGKLDESDRPAKGNPTPLLQELELIAARSEQDVVIIDDVHTFGRPDGQWDDIDEGKIIEILGGDGLRANEISDHLAIWPKSELDS